MNSINRNNFILIDKDATKRSCYISIITIHTLGGFFVE